jgi:methionyl-tRNA formyltransferase
VEFAFTGKISPMNKTPRIVFMGSPTFALPTLQALQEHYSVVGVVTQPDRPSGRGRTLKPPPVKAMADSLGLEVIQPQRLKDPQAMQQLLYWQPDLIVVAAFGQILRPAVLDLPSLGCINVHASLLPRWRGAAPVAAAILHGDPYTGITIMRMDPGIDTGPMLSQQKIPILQQDTTETLGGRLAALGAQLLIDTLPGYLDGSIPPLLQDDALASYAPMLQKQDGKLDFQQTAQELERKVRAFNPWPGAFTLWHGEPFKIHMAHTAIRSGAPGEHLEINDLPAIACGEGSLVLDLVQLPGKRPAAGEVFLRGARDWINSRG